MLYKQLYHILFTGYNRIKDSNSMLSDMTAKDKEIKMSELTLEKQSSTTDFVGGKWQSEINVRDFIQKTTHLMMVILASWQVLLKLQLNCGRNAANCSKRTRKRRCT